VRQRHNVRVCTRSHALVREAVGTRVAEQMLMMLLLMSLFALSCLLSAVWFATRGDTVVWPQGGAEPGAQRARALRRHPRRLSSHVAGQQPT
jgi:hypothetical protein